MCLYADHTIDVHHPLTTAFCYIPFCLFRGNFEHNLGFVHNGLPIIVLINQKIETYSLQST
jgi:hypothetical protein